MKNTTLVGNVGENIAVDYLKEKGYRILERNAKICGTEIDIICEVYLDVNNRVISANGKASLIDRLFKTDSVKHKIGNATRTIVFCEVKTRRDDEFGSGAEAVTPYKIGRYITGAKAYMAKKSNVNANARFDVIEIGKSGINHIENAFDEGDAKYPRSR